MTKWFNDAKCSLVDANILSSPAIGIVKFINVFYIANVSTLLSVVNALELKDHLYKQAKNLSAGIKRKVS